MHGHIETLLHLLYEIYLNFLFDFYNIRPRNQKAKFQKEKEFNHLLINLNIH